MTDLEIETELSQLSDQDLIRIAEDAMDQVILSRREVLALQELVWREFRTRLNGTSRTGRLPTRQSRPDERARCRSARRASGSFGRNSRSNAVAQSRSAFNDSCAREIGRIRLGEDRDVRLARRHLTIARFANRSKGRRC
jgi:hypothetical protein